MQLDNDDLFPFSDELTDNASSLSSLNADAEANAQFRTIATQLATTKRQYASISAQLQEIAEQNDKHKQHLEDVNSAELKAQQEAIEKQIAELTSSSQIEQQKIQQLFDQKITDQRRQGDAALQQLRARRSKDESKQAQLDSEKELALIKANERYQSFTQSIYVLEDQLSSLRNGLPDSAGAESTLEFDRERKLDDRMRKIGDQCTKLKEELNALTSIWQRFKASAMLSLFFQFCLILIAAAGIYGLWQILPNKQVAIGIPTAGWFIFALLIFLGRRSSIKYRLKLLATYSADTDVIEKEIERCKRRGEKKYNPETVMNRAADELLEKQAEIEAREQTAIITARKNIDDYKLKLEGDIEELTKQRDTQLQTVTQQFATQQNELRNRFAELEPQHTQQLTTQLNDNKQELATKKQQLMSSYHEQQEKLRSVCQGMLHDVRNGHQTWDSNSWESWSPASTFPGTLSLGHLSINEASLATSHGLPVANDASTLQIPLDLWIPESPLLFIKADEQKALPCLHQCMLRFLASSPPGQTRFSILDPRGLGEKFASFLKLIDLEEHLIGSKIWTSQSEIEQRLADLCEHAEKIIQKYLRDEFSSLADYNKAAGELAEPYQVLVIADFPNGFSPVAMERLAALIGYGPRCGIIVWLQAGNEASLPKEIDLQHFYKRGLVLEEQQGRICLSQEELGTLECTLEELPSPQRADYILQQVGEHAASAANRAVPMSAGAPEAEAIWSGDTSRDVRLPIGRSGADRLQFMELGHGTAQHVLIGGRTGSGKSTLLHVLITNGALWYGPDQLAFYLVDFKKGVEFKTYANAQLPHAKVIAVESDREYALSVLRHIDSELEQRGSLFRDLGVQDLAGFRKARPDTSMPRSLLVIDEFHEFFSEDDAIARDAALLLERFVRQGRAFGIHVILGSQSIGGSMGLARSAIGQMGVRIALQCNEADSQLILSDENVAARLLERPGEGIYNAQSGLSAGNNPFQVFWVDEEEQESLLKDIAQKNPNPHQVPWVFEGNIPADFAKNTDFFGEISKPYGAAPKNLSCWLGEPNAIRSHISLKLPDRSGGNLLMVGHNREAVVGMCMANLASMAFYYPPAGCEILLIDTDDDDERLQAKLHEFAKCLPHQIAIRGVSDGIDAITELSQKMKDSNEKLKPTLVIILGHGRMRALRQEDDFSFGSSSETKASDHFVDLLADGPEKGIHALVWCETPNVVKNSFQRSALRHFDQRLLFQMSSGDSADLIEDSAASRLGIHHALLCDLEAVKMEKFRPYTPFDESLSNKVIEAIKQRQ